MYSSLIFQRFSEYHGNPEVLTTPQKFLGLHSPKVLEFWEKIEKLTQEQLRVVNERYLAFRNENRSEWVESIDLAIDASEGVVGEDYANDAGWAAIIVTNSWAAGLATGELIGGVENPVFLKMFDDL